MKESMNKVFLSAPNSGLSQQKLFNNLVHNTARCAQMFTSKRPTMLESMFSLDSSRDHSHIETLGKDIALMGRCLLVVFGKDWNKGSVGCCIESEIVEAFGVPRVDLVTGNVNRPLESAGLLIANPTPKKLLHAGMVHNCYMEIQYRSIKDLSESTIIVHFDPDIYGCYPSEFIKSISERMLKE